MPRLLGIVLGLLAVCAALVWELCSLLGALSRAWDEGLAERTDLFEGSFERAGR